MSFTKRSRGFTLIELLVALAILAILAVLVLVNLNTRKRAGEINALQKSAQQVVTASKLYLDDNPKTTVIKASLLSPNYMTELPASQEVVGGNIIVSGGTSVDFDLMSSAGATDGCAVHVVDGKVPTTDEVTNTCP